MKLTKTTYAAMAKTIGTITTCQSDEHRYLTGRKVIIIAILKNATSDDVDGSDYQVIDDDADLARAGGVSSDDRVEVQPWIVEKGRFSFASSDPKACDLACFAQ